MRPERLAAVLVAVTILSGCSGGASNEDNAGPTPYVPSPPRVENSSVVEPSQTSQQSSNALHCPDSDSREAAKAEKKRSIVLDKDRSEPILIMAGGATLRIAPGATMSGKVTLCGAAATLIIQGNLTGQALVEGGGPRLILVDDAKDPCVRLVGGGPETIVCGEHKPIEPSCERYF